MNPEVKPPAESQRSPSKGKEKEVSSPAPTRLSATSETPINKGKAREVLKTLLKLPEAAFRGPNTGRLSNVLLFGLSNVGSD